ncbi:MAG TPA: class I SAM-dependent methyltransferase [Candidatus Dormibacteraeota bacterium]|nr:class I SAM-dependent methyltransferase [Candidatus Dormibacteraeota bacterium]
MPSNLAEWDTKHRQRAQDSPSGPASLVRELLPLLPRGAALDLACGTGRHALLLAERHQPVTGVDWSPAALEILEERATAAHLNFRRCRNLQETTSGTYTGLQLVQWDLEQTRPQELPPESFDLILCIQYLQRSLFQQMERALRPGGVLLFETYTRAQLCLAGGGLRDEGLPGKGLAVGPKNPAYLLAPGELRSAFPGLHLLFYRELRARQGIASLVAQKLETG